MKIYLLNPPFVKGFVRCGRWQGAVARSGGLDYPKWLAYATGLLEKDFDVKLVDAPARKLSKEDILRFHFFHQKKNAFRARFHVYLEPSRVLHVIALSHQNTYPNFVARKYFGLTYGLLQSLAD